MGRNSSLIVRLPFIVITKRKVGLYWETSQLIHNCLLSFHLPHSFQGLSGNVSDLIWFFFSSRFLAMFYYTIRDSFWFFPLFFHHFPFFFFIDLIEYLKHSSGFSIAFRHYNDSLQGSKVYALGCLITCLMGLFRIAFKNGYEAKRKRGFIERSDLL